MFSGFCCCFFHLFWLSANVCSITPRGVLCSDGVSLPRALNRSAMFLCSEHSLIRSAQPTMQKLPVLSLLFMCVLPPDPPLAALLLETVFSWLWPWPSAAVLLFFLLRFVSLISHTHCIIHTKSDKLHCWQLYFRILRLKTESKVFKTAQKWR